MARSLIPLPLVLLACLLAAPGARAAETESTVTGMGMSTIEKQAETLRLQMDLQVEGPTLKDALEKLKTRRDAIKAGLIKLGAVESTFQAADTRTADAESGNNRAAMERLMRERMAGRTAATAAGPKSVTVTCNIKMDWPLKGASAEELLIAAGAIRDQLKASKLLESPKTPAQEEAAAEAAAEASSSDEPAVNEPIFMYVAKVNEAEQAKATADAFTKAKQSATRLAKAAGSDLGSLRSLTSQGSSDSSDSMYQNYYSGSSSMRYYYQQMMAQRGRSDEPSEVFAMQPGKVTQSIMVQATFSLK